MYSIRIWYFVKPIGRAGIHCLRVRNSDPRIPTFVKSYAPVGWNTTVQYLFHPTPAQERFEIQTRFRAWEKDIIIEDPPPSLV